LKHYFEKERLVTAEDLIQEKIGKNKNLSELENWKENETESSEASLVTLRSPGTGAIKHYRFVVYE
jgi:hypothetical protein